MLSPEGRVAARLEKISQEIMEMMPNLMDEPLKIMQAGNLSYEQFCVAARHLTFDHQIVGWSKVALLCHFAREVAIMGEMDDSQLELLAEYSFRFIQESTAEWIEKKGGWVSIAPQGSHLRPDVGCNVMFAKLPLFAVSSRHAQKCRIITKCPLALILTLTQAILSNARSYGN